MGRRGGWSGWDVNEAVKGRLEELGYRMEGISSKAEEMDMGCLDELESMVFH